MAAQITALPTPPTRQDPTNFNDRADAFLAALPGFQSEANALSTEVNTRADNVEAANLAVTAATNITKWVTGTSVTSGAVVWSPINGLGYRRITATGSGTTDPSLDTTNYKQINGTGDVSTSGAQTIGGAKTFSTPPSLSSATANSVAFINASKQLSGTNAISFDGTSLGVGDVSPTTNGTLSVYSSSANDVRLAVTNSSLPAPDEFRQVRILQAGATASSVAVWASSGIVEATSSGGLAIGAFSSTPTPIKFYTGASRLERARIDGYGNFLINTTVGSVNTGGFAFLPDNGGTGVSQMNIGHTNGSPSGSGYTTFAYNGTSIGSISQSGTTSVAYNTSSDYRLKYDITPMQGGLERVKLLKPVTYKWCADDSIGEGFIAHELAEVCPHAVTGDKDAVATDGSPVYQGIDTSFLVSTLVSAIQEQQIMISNLTSRIEVLEATLPN